jgi:hypothetical protein
VRRSHSARTGAGRSRTLTRSVSTVYICLRPFRRLPRLGDLPHSPPPRLFEAITEPVLVDQAAATHAHVR